MKLRKFLFSGAALMALTAAFGFTKGKKGAFFGVPADGYYAASHLCVTSNIPTNQNICLWYATGPQCTVTLGVYGALPAFEKNTTPTCSVPLYQFQ
jgi:hypothetical protein